MVVPLRRQGDGPLDALVVHRLPASLTGGLGETLASMLRAFLATFDEPDAALAELRKDPRWEREHVEALLELCCENVQTPVELPLRELSPGMVFADDVKTTDGTLLVAKGLEVTGSLLQRLLNREGLVAEPLRVLRS